MVQKFEVGKRYTCKWVKDPITVVAVGEEYLIGKVYSGPERVFTTHPDNRWTEYHEPKVEKFKRFVVRNDVDSEMIVDTNEPQWGYTTLGKIEIILTDGKLTSVEIMKE